MATVATTTRTVRLHGNINNILNSVFSEIVGVLKPLCHVSSPITIVQMPGNAAYGVQDTLQCDCDCVAANDTTFVAALNSATHGPAGNQTWAQYLGTAGAILDTDSIASTLGH